MNKHIYVALAAMTLGAMAFPVFADHSGCGDVQITSSQIVGEGDGYWLVSGNCLEQVTNVALANDFGNGFEELDFQHVDTGGNDSLQIPLVSRTGLGSSIPLGQYLLQVSKCETSHDKQKCKVLDEKYLIAPLQVASPLPQSGDACNNDGYIYFDPSQNELYGCPVDGTYDLYCSNGTTWICANNAGG